MKLFSLLNPLWIIETFFTLYGGGGSKGGGSSTQTSYSTNLPEYAKPYYDELLKQTGRETFATDSLGRVVGVQAYQPYQGQRVAGFSPAQLATQQETMNMRTPEGFGQGIAGLSAGQQGSLTAAQAGLGQALGYQAGPLEQMGVRQAPVFDNGIASFYMSPYQQNVTDIALQEARLEADRQRSQSALGSISRGTFGGARNALAQATADTGNVANMAKIRAQGQQDAFLNAQQQFERDRTAGMATDRTNLESELDRRKLEQQAQQFQAGLGKDLFATGLSGLSDTSKGIGALASAEQDAILSRLQAQSAVGNAQQQLAQDVLDKQYQEAMEQRDWGKRQLEFYSNILRGNAGALGTTQVQYSPAPDPTSQIAGLGLAGLGLYKALK